MHSNSPLLRLYTVLYREVTSPCMGEQASYFPEGQNHLGLAYVSPSPSTVAGTGLQDEMWRLSLGLGWSKGSIHDSNGGDSEQRHKSPMRRCPGKHPQAGQHHMEEASSHAEGRRTWQGTWMWSEGLRWWDLSCFSSLGSVILPGGR